MNDLHITVKCRPDGIQIFSPDDLKYNISRQYERDSFFYEESNSFLLFIGVCYNKKDIVDCYDNKSWQSMMFHRFKQDRVKLLEQLDGCFCGLFYNSQNKDILIFSDHISSLPVYYYRSAEYFIVDTDIFSLAEELRRLNIPIKLSEFGAYSMLTYSFMLDNYTLLSDVYKVLPSSIYSYRLDKTEKYFEYYSTDKNTSASIEDIADGVDDLFSRAVADSLSIDGDSSHLFTLSGGLDSRMYLLYALEHGCFNITTLNYSQTFYREEVIAKKIAADCGCEHIFFSLDNGNYLSNIDEGIRATQGMTTYRPILSARAVWNQLNMECYNTVHTGLLGDAILGGYCVEKCNIDNHFHSATDFAIQLNAKNKTIFSAAYAEEFLPLFNRITDWIPVSSLNSLESEKYVLDNRYINGLMQSALGTRGITIPVSPYTSKRLMKYVFSFPSKIRLNHKLYFVWMNKYMPLATEYTWENTGLKPRYGKFQIKPDSPAVTLFKNVESVFRSSKPENSRNPYNYWMKNNNNIQKEIYDYCNNKLFLLEKYPELLGVAQQILKYDNIYLLIRLASLLGFLYMCLFRKGELNDI